tara:strand:+ start:3888 stop:5975 length:2088 start_codon:yes stop_codon:yes gene_type:complete
MAEQNTITIQFGAKGDEDVIKAIDKLDRSTKKLINTQAKLVNRNKQQKTQEDKNKKSIDTLRVKLQALGLDYNKIILQNKNYSSAMNGSRVALEKLKISTRKFIAEQQKADISTRILGGSFAVLRSKMLLFNFALGLGVRQIGRLVGEASRVQAMETAFNTLSGATENSSIALSKLTDATDGTMASFDLFQQANNAMILGVTKNSDEMAEMFDIAQRLGRALGRDTASSVESLVTGIGRQSRLMLDNIGIIVKSEEAYERFAQANNTTVDALTDAQKKQAFLEATMESARAKVKTLGEETLTTKDRFDQLSASSADLSTEIGKTLAPLFGSLAKNTTNVFSNMTELLKIFNHTKGTALEFALATEEAEQMIEKLTKNTNINIDSNKSLRDQLVDVGLHYSLNLGTTRKLSNMMHKLKETEKAYKEEVAKQKELEEVRNKQIEQSNKLKETEEQKAEQEKINAEQAKFISEQRNIQQQQALEQMQALIQATKDLHTQELLATQAVEANISNTNLQVDVMKLLDTQQKFAVSNMMNLSNAMADAMINGQNMGDAVVSSLKAIATQLIAKAGVYALLSTFFAPKELATATGGFLNFLIAHTGGLVKDNKIQKFATGGQVQGRDNVPIMAQAGEFIIRKEIVDRVGVDSLASLNNGETSTNNNTINVTIQGGVVDDSYVNNTLIPALNKATSLGNKINA